VNVHDCRWSVCTTVRSAAGTFDSDASVVRSGVSPRLGGEASITRSNRPGLPARWASTPTTESTSVLGAGVVGPVLAASSRRWASVTPAVASTIEARVLASSRPALMRCRSRTPMRPTTSIENASVVPTTRRETERRHHCNGLPRVAETRCHRSDQDVMGSAGAHQDGPAL